MPEAAAPRALAGLSVVTRTRAQTHTHIQGLTETQTDRQTDREVAKRCQQQRPVGTAVGRMRTMREQAQAVNVRSGFSTQQADETELRPGGTAVSAVTA